jgi:hypothetical protein
MGCGDANKTTRNKGASVEIPSGKHTKEETRGTKRLYRDGSREVGRVLKYGSISVGVRRKIFTRCVCGCARRETRPEAARWRDGWHRVASSPLEREYGDANKKKTNPRGKNAHKHSTKTNQHTKSFRREDDPRHKSKRLLQTSIRPIDNIVTSSPFTHHRIVPGFRYSSNDNIRLTDSATQRFRHCSTGHHGSCTRSKAIPPGLLPDSH